VQGQPAAYGDPLYNISIKTGMKRAAPSYAVRRRSASTMPKSLPGLREYHCR
jgi:hypothetical protein